jgi:hypothetical protein
MVVAEVEEEVEEKVEAEEKELVRLVEAMLENLVEEGFAVGDRVGLISVTCPFTIQTPFPESQHPLAKVPLPQHRLPSRQIVITVSVSLIGTPS